MASGLISSVNGFYVKNFPTIPHFAPLCQLILPPFPFLDINKLLTNASITHFLRLPRHLRSDFITKSTKTEKQVN